MHESSIVEKLDAMQPQAHVHAWNNDKLLLVQSISIGLQDEQALHKQVQYIFYHIGIKRIDSLAFKVEIFF